MADGTTTPCRQYRIDVCIQGPPDAQVPVMDWFEDDVACPRNDAVHRLSGITFLEHCFMGSTPGPLPEIYLGHKKSHVTDRMLAHY